MIENGLMCPQHRTCHQNISSPTFVTNIDGPRIQDSVTLKHEGPTLNKALSLDYRPCSDSESRSPRALRTKIIRKVLVAC